MLNHDSSNARARLVRLVQIGRRDLALAEDSYRFIIRQQTNGRTDSSTQCTVIELEAIVSHFKKCGFKIKPAKKPQSRTLAADSHSKVIRGLWLELHTLGYVNDPSEAALAAFCKRMTKVDALQWLNGDQQAALIEELKKWRNRDALKLAKRIGLAGYQHKQLTRLAEICASLTGSELLSKANLAAVSAAYEQRGA